MASLLPDADVGSCSPDADPFKPPVIATAVRCMHCDQEYDSLKIHWVLDASFGAGGEYWGCPTTGCDGKGFCFDIWPTDPEWRDENGQKVWFDDAEPEDDGDDGESDDQPSLLL